VLLQNDERFIKNIRRRILEINTNWRKMKNLFLISLMTFVLALSLATTVCASTGSLGVSINEIVIDDLHISSGSTATIAGFAGDTTSVTVHFTSNIDVSDAVVKMWIGGEDAVESGKIHLVNGSTYSETLSVKLPEDIDPEETFTLYAEVETQNSYKQEAFNLKLQRESYDLSILDVDMDRTVEAGNSLQANIVIKNVGYEELQDVFVVISSDELGISKKIYFYDLQAQDCTDNCEDDEQDSAQKTVTLNIPSSAKEGSYTITVEAHNSETTQKVTKQIFVSGGQESTTVFVPVNSKEIKTGETATYDLIIVNSGKKIAVYQLQTEANGNIVVSLDESIVTIPAGTSKTVKVNVKASSEGTYNFAVNLMSDNKLVQKVNLNATVVKGRAIKNITALTIALAVIFIVLLIVLIVLLTRKPARESLEESYY
jgi:hypothetical protein